MVPIVLDENVSLDLAALLRKQDYDVLAIAELQKHRGMTDEEIWKEVKKRQALLISRDYHFTNPSRFPPEAVFAVLYLRYGNLTSVQEIHLVLGFLRNHSEEDFRGKLVTLSPFSITIR